MLSDGQSDSDPLRRVLIERLPPLTWRGIGGYAAAGGAGLVFLLVVRTGGFLTLAAALVLVVSSVQVLRGLTRLLWLRMGGTDQPLRSYLRRRLRR